MTEINFELPPQFRNPDGLEHPVIYMYTKRDRQGNVIGKKIFRVVESDDTTFPYTVINPQTGREVRLGATHWDNIYRGNLNKEPPNDLARRVKLYYEIRERKLKEKIRKMSPQYAPFEDPEEESAA